MITTEITKDVAVVSYVYNELKDVIGGPGAPTVEEVDWEWHFVNDLFVLAKDGETVAGVVAFYRREGAWEAHMNMLRGHRGDKAQAAFEQAVEKLREATGASKLVTSVAKKFPNVCAFVERQGAAIVKETEYEKHYVLEIL